MSAIPHPATTSTPTVASSSHTELLEQLKAQLEPSLLAAVSGKFSSYEYELQHAQMKVQVLEERLRLARMAKYGKASETLSDLQLELLELEPGVSSEEVQAESDRGPLPPSDKPEEESAQQNKRRKHPGRHTLPAHLERVEKIIACAPGQCICGGCGKETTVIGYEESEVLDVKPAEYFVRVTRREKRACRQCEEQGVAVAPAPECIIPKSLVSDQVIIDTVVGKYADSLPICRAALKSRTSRLYFSTIFHDLTAVLQHINRGLGYVNRGQNYA